MVVTGDRGGQREFTLVECVNPVDRLTSPVLLSILSPAHVAGHLKHNFAELLVVEFNSERLLREDSILVPGIDVIAGLRSRSVGRGFSE